MVRGQAQAAVKLALLALELFTRQTIQAGWQRSPVRSQWGVGAGLASQSDSRLRRLAVLQGHRAPEPLLKESGAPGAFPN